MTITERVTSILKHSSIARNSDNELYLIYLQKSGLDLDERQARIFRELPINSIRRIRQKIQEDTPEKEGLYKADDKIRKERAHKAMVMEQTSPTFKPEQLENTLTLPLPWGKA